MADSYSPNLKLATPTPGSQTWNNELDANRKILDSQNGIGDLAVTTHEMPSSTSLLFDVSAGLYLNQAGAISSYAGSTSNAATASATTYVWLTNAGVLTMSTAGWPTGLCIPLAAIVAGASSLTSIADARVAYFVCGNPCLPLAGGTLADGANIALGTATGTQLGTAATQKLAFFGKTPIVQPTVGAATAGSTYGTNEQTMLQTIYNAIRALGLGS